MENKSIVFSNYDDLQNPYYAGGGAVATHEMAKRLAKKNRVTVYTSKYPNSINQVIDEVEYIRIGLGIFDPRLEQLIFQLILPYYVIKTNFDTWVECITPPFPFDVLQLFTSKPVIAMIHMLPAKDMERKYHLPFRFFEKLLLNMYRYIGTVTETLLEKVQKINNNAKTFVVHNGVNMDTSNISKSEATHDQHILFLGRIEFDQKGLDLLITAFSKLKNTNVKLIIAGSGIKSEEHKLHKIISTLNLQEKIELVGRVDSIQKSNLLNNALFMVAPSRYETFGIVALEAMAHGVPVITFEIDGFNWMPKKTCLKAKPYSVENLTSKMQELIDNVGLRSEMSKICKTSALDFSWEASFNKFNRMLLEVTLDSSASESSSHSLRYDSH